MEQELKNRITNISEMVKETANFFADIQSIYYDLVQELGGKNLISKTLQGNQKFGNKTDGYFYQHLQKSENGLLLGLSIDVTTFNGTLNYNKFDMTLEQLEMNKKVPLLITYGCFTLVDKNIEKVNCDHFFSYCQGILDENEEKFIYTNFDKTKIAFARENIVENVNWTSKENTEEFVDWKSFFSQAKIKFKPLLELTNHEEVKKLADEIKAMGF